MNYALRYHFPALIGKWLARAFLNIRVTGKENIPSCSPFLLICNHISHFDPPLLGIVVPHYLAWVVAADLYTNPLLRIFFKWVNAIPINRQITDRRAVKEILTRLKYKENIGLFPEGGIRFSTDSLLYGHPMDKTVAAIAHLAQIPILPAVILGSDKLYNYKTWFRKITIDIAFAPIISPAQFTGNSTQIRQQINETAANTIQKLFHEIKERFQLTPEDLPKSFQIRWAEIHKS